MGKKRLLRKLDEQAAAETEARKQKDLASGAYSINPDTGKPMEKTVEPAKQVRMVETTNLKPMEGSSREVITTTEKPITTPSEAFVGDRKYLDSVDIQNTRKEVAEGLNTSSIAKRGELTGNYQITPGEMDASIAQTKKEEADRLINRDAEAAKLSDPDNAALYDYNAAQLKANNAAVGDEKMNEILSDEKPVTAIQQVFDKYEQTGDESVLAGITLKDVEKIKESADEDMLLGMDEQAANQYKQYKKIVEKFGPKPEPAIEKLGVTDYYPDMGQPLQVGSYSGSIVGSIPIFTAKGGVLPMGVYDARRRALQKQADDKEKQRLQLFEMAKMAAAPQYQQELDDEAYRTINDYLKAVNYNITPGDENWMALQQNLNRVNNVKKGTLEIQAWTNKIIDDLSKSDRFVPEYKQKLAAKWLRGGYTMSDLINDPKKQKELYNLRNEIKSYDNLANYTAEYVKKLKEADAKSTVPLAANFRDKLSEIPATQQDELIASAADGDFNKFMTLTMKYMPDSDIALHAKKLWESSDFYDKELGPEKYAEYLDYFNSWIGKEIIPKVTILKNDRLGWYKEANRIKERAEDKITRWQTIAQNSMSDNTKSVIANAGNMNATDWLKSLSQANNGMKFTTDKNGKVYGTFEIADSEKNKRPSRLGDEQVFGMKFSDWKKSIPTKPDFKSGKTVVDIDKIPKDQLALARYVIEGEHDENAIVDIQTTGYMVYPEYKTPDGQKRFLTQEDAAKNPGIANNLGTATFREGAIVIKETRNIGTKDDPYYKEVEVTIPTKSFKRYDLGSADELNELDAATRGDTEINIQKNHDFPIDFNVEGQSAVIGKESGIQTEAVY